MNADFYCRECGRPLEQAFDGSGEWWWKYDDWCKTGAWVCPAVPENFPNHLRVHNPISRHDLVAVLTTMKQHVERAAHELNQVYEIWMQTRFPGDRWHESVYPFKLSLDEQAFEVQGWADGIAEEIDVIEGRA